MAKKKAARSRRVVEVLDAKHPGFVSLKISVDPEFRDLIPPLTADEKRALEASVVASNGPHTEIDVWRLSADSPICLVTDGHNRFEICERLGLPFKVRQHAFPDRDAAKAWIFQHQIARRNLSHDQIVALAAARGVFSDRGTALQRQRAAELAEHAPEKLAAVIKGPLSLAIVHGAWAKATGRAKPRTKAPTGKPYIVPPAHELHARSTRTDENGEEVGAWDKTRIASVEPDFDPEAEGHLVTRTATMRDAAGNVRARWTSTSPDAVTREKAFKEAAREHASLYDGLAGISVPPAVTSANTRTEYLLGDPHIGMLAYAPEAGEHFDLKIACRELLTCVRLLIASAPQSETASIVNLGDFFHAQDNAQRTPGHGHKLDVDGRHGKVSRLAMVLFRGMIDAALERHRIVIARNLPGNHDPDEATRVSELLAAWYRNDPRVVIAEADAAFQYDRFGVNLFGYHHGHGTKAEALPGIMANDRADDWGATTERVWHCGHIHHLTRKEFPGCTVETHRTMAAKDAWHAAQGYRSGRSLQAITYHEAFGEVSRATVNLAQVRAALAAGKVAS